MENDDLQYELNDVEKEVWSNIENYTSLIMKGDVVGFLEYFHNNYTGWNYKAFMPVKKSDIKNELLHLPKRKIIEYEIIPLSIQVINKTAIVHYTYSVGYKNAGGSKHKKSCRNTDILVRQKDKWLLVADHVGISHEISP